MGAAALIASFAMDGTLRMAFLALAIVLPGLMLQDSWRYAFFAAGRGHHSFLNDTVWTLMMVPAVLALRATHHRSVFWFILLWGAAAAIAACVGPLQARVIPKPWRAREWVVEHRDLGLRFLAENTSNAGATQLRAYCIGGIAGLAAVGYVQAATLLMGPFMVVFAGISIVTVPEAARVLRSAPWHLGRTCWLIGGGLAAAGALWGGALLIAIPRGLGSLLLGSGLWHHAYLLIIPYTISIMGSCVSDGLSSGLHALSAARRSLRAMIFTSALYLGLGIIGAYLDGPVGVVWGAAISTWVGTALWAYQFRTAIHDHHREYADNRIRISWGPVREPSFTPRSPSFTPRPPTTRAARGRER
jgi:O-antigen/teichoic acid export membrane protein